MAEERVHVPSEARSAADSTGESLANGRYVIFGQLGQGSQAETLKAVDKLQGQTVAIKRFRIGHAKTWKDVELAEREARILATLNHPALPRYVEHFEEQGCLYLVMECVEGQSLAEHAKQGGRLGLPELRRLLLMLSDVLGYLHSRIPAVIHRDIKPGNIIYRPDGSFCLVDFGSVRDGLRPDGGSTVVGTFGYMAPEQFQGRAQASTDLYAVGVLLLCLITNRPPEDLPHRGLALDAEAALGHSLPAAWVQMISQLVNLDPDQRPHSLAPLLQTLDAGGTAVPGGTNTPFDASASGGASQGSTADPDAAFTPEVEEPSSAFTAVVGTNFGPVPFLVLLIARLAIWAALCVGVPLLLQILSIFFGAQLRRAARRVYAAGQLAQTRLAEAARHLQRSEPFMLEGRRYHRRHRRSRGWPATDRSWQDPARDWRQQVRIDLPGFVDDVTRHTAPGKTKDHESARRRPAALFDDSNDADSGNTTKKQNK
jgi:tRNA A-37 threonylcarbamoyl transferase component Bud32